jgi:hypothetical protein
MAATTTAIVHFVPDHMTLTTSCGKPAYRRRCQFGNVAQTGPVLEVTCPKCLVAMLARGK